MRLLSRFLQQNTHDLRRRHHHLSFFSEPLPLTINLRRSSYRPRARVSRLSSAIAFTNRQAEFCRKRRELFRLRLRNSRTGSRLSNSCRWSSCRLVGSSRQREKRRPRFSFHWLFFPRVIIVCPSCWSSQFFFVSFYSLTQSTRDPARQEWQASFDSPMNTSRIQRHSTGSTTRSRLRSAHRFASLFIRARNDEEEREGRNAPVNRD